MKNFLPILAVIFISCQNTKDGNEVTLISQADAIERAKANNLDYSYATFIGANGPLTKEENSLLNKGKLARDFYQNATGEITEVRVRPIQLADKFFEIQIRSASTNPLASIEFISTDCNNLDAIFQEVHDSDQQVRTGDGDMSSVDAKNRQIVISSIFNCGWSEQHLETIWLVFQHSPSGIMAYFYPYLKNYSEEGRLSKSSMALMEDRLLMNNGYKQIYGSQISGGILFDMEEPDSVNARRKTMNLGPIEDYLLHFDLDWGEELTRLKAMEGE